jgi:transcriptional regulator with XRE-family HTH domain
MHRTYMWGIERGTRNPSLRHVARLAAALGVPLSTLFREM